MLQRQHHVSIVVDGSVTHTIVCTPEHLAELALGRLFCDRVITSCDDVASLHLCKQGDVVKVELTRPVALAPIVPEHASTCASMREAHASAVSDASLPPLALRAFDRRWIFSLAREFAQDTPMHKKTRGAHSCFLAQNGTILFFCEDLGRHNAFDKAIGWALRHNIDLTRCIALTSGRVPTDMAIKAIRAQIPVLLSASVPTDETLVLARQKNLALIGQVRDGQVSVFHDPTKSMGEPARRFVLQTGAEASLAG